MFGIGQWELLFILLCLAAPVVIGGVVVVVILAVGRGQDRRQ